MHRRSFSIVLAIALISFAGVAPAGPAPADTAEPKLPAVGDKAPDFSLNDFSGKPFSLGALNGREGALLWFTNICEGCRSKFPQVEKFRKQFGGKGVEIIAVSQLGKDRKTVEDAIRANHLGVRFLYDPDGAATTRYSGGYTPGTCPIKNLYIVDRSGTIVYATHYPGAGDSEISTRLAAIQGKSPGAAGR